MSKILIIGCGSVGKSIASALIRMQLQQLVNEIVVAENKVKEAFNGFAMEVVAIDELTPIAPVKYKASTDDRAQWKHNKARHNVRGRK